LISKYQKIILNIIKP